MAKYANFKRKTPAFAIDYLGSSEHRRLAKGNKRESTMYATLFLIWSTECRKPSRAYTTRSENIQGLILLLAMTSLSHLWLNDSLIEIWSLDSYIPVTSLTLKSIEILNHLLHRGTNSRGRHMLNRSTIIKPFATCNYTRYKWRLNALNQAIITSDR